MIRKEAVVSVVAKRVNPPPTVLATLMSPISVLAIPVPIQLAADVPEKAVEDSPGDLLETVGSSFRTIQLWLLLPCGE